MIKKRSVVRYAVVVFVCLFSGFVLRAEAEGPHGADNPLKAEMRQLDGAFKNVINDIVLGNLEAIEKHLNKIDALREKTHDALEKGEIKLPKNEKNIKLFAELDDEFHDMVERLVKLSKNGNKKAVTRTAHKLLDACVRCHEAFRQ